MTRANGVFPADFPSKPGGEAPYGGETREELVWILRAL